MIDHIQLRVRSFEKSREFYAKALAPIGYGAQYDDPKSKVVGFGVKGEIDLWIREGSPLGHAHLAFRVKVRTAVDGFHAAATAAGGKDNGAPGIRKGYSPTYYAAFVIDPDGNNLEVVCHEEA
jgi:catechol 2,3-dioxygenase-like lactoylglutathione lyase family enzyme